jgi:hypothetical protein
MAPFDPEMEDWLTRKREEEDPALAEALAVPADEPDTEPDTEPDISGALEALPSLPGPVAPSAAPAAPSSLDAEYRTASEADAKSAGRATLANLLNRSVDMMRGRPTAPVNLLGGKGSEVANFLMRQKLKGGGGRQLHPAQVAKLEADADLARGRLSVLGRDKDGKPVDPMDDPNSESSRAYIRTHNRFVAPENQLKEGEHTGNSVKGLLGTVGKERDITKDKSKEDRDKAMGRFITQSIEFAPGVPADYVPDKTERDRVDKIVRGASVMIPAIKEYRDAWASMLKKYEGVGGVVDDTGGINVNKMKRGDVAKLMAHASELLIDMKTKYELGVIAGPDMDIVGGSIPLFNPIWSDLMAKAGGVPEIAMKLLSKYGNKEIEAMMQNRSFKIIDDPTITLDTTADRMRRRYSRELGERYTVKKNPWDWSPTGAPAYPVATRKELE